MNLGIYQSASALSALERWQDSVSQNITASQTSGYRKRTVNFSAVTAGELHTAKGSRVGGAEAKPISFPKASYGVNFTNGETQPTRRELDVAIEGDGFFEIQREDGSRAFTRNGQFQLRADRTLVTGSGAQVMSDSGSPITAIAGGGPLTINRDGSIFQGQNSVGTLAVRTFPNKAALYSISGDLFMTAPDTKPQQVEKPELMQGYIEGSNVVALREMVDLLLIARSYEANQKIIKTADEQMGKTLEALG
jgi:flagellar basal-body rod protein FlgF